MAHPRVQSQEKKKTVCRGKEGMTEQKPLGKEGTSHTNIQGIRQELGVASTKDLIWECVQH